MAMGGFAFARLVEAAKREKGIEAKVERVLLMLRHPNADMRDAGNGAIRSGADAREVWQKMLDEALGDKI